MKHDAQISAEFTVLAKKSSIEKDISKAKRTKDTTVFLGGDVKDKQWRGQIKNKFADKFSFIDPYDRNWEATDNIYSECQGMLIADEVLFYRGGDLSEKEQSFLRGLGRKYKTFSSVSSLSKYLESLN
jgi:hypothetical protein